MFWYYNDVKITDLHEDIVGFVYIIHYLDNTSYIGKKLVRSYRKKKPLKGMRLNARRMVLTEHKWKDYEGSHGVDKEIVSKHILHMCTNKMTLTWMEIREMVDRRVLTDDKYLNKNISGKWYNNCEDGLFNTNHTQQELFNETDKKNTKEKE